MKNIRRIPKRNLILVLLSHVGVVIMSTAISISIMGQAWQKDGWNNYAVKEYTQTEQFSSDMSIMVSSLAKYIKERENFETDGFYDPDKVIDVYDYANNGLVSGESINGLAYRLEDLHAWVEIDNSYARWLQKTQDKEGTLDIEAAGEFVERYAPIGFDSIEDMAASDKNIRGLAADQWKVYLAGVLKRIDGDINEYARLKNTFSAGGSNLEYRITNLNTGRIYKNVDKTGDELDGSEFYLSFKTGGYELDTNMPLKDRQKSRIIRELGHDLAGNCVYSVKIAVDTSFSADDRFQQSKEMFDKWGSWIRRSFWVMLVTGMAILLCFCILCALAGRVPGKDVIVFYPMDGIRTELLLLLLLCSLGAGGTAIGLLWHMNYIQEITIGGTAAAAFVTSVFLLSQILSLVRRGKARTLWSNSILNILVGNMRELRKNTKTLKTTVLVFLAYLVVNVILLQFGFVGKILCAVWNLYAGILILQEAAQRQKVLTGVRKIADGELDYTIPVEDLGGDNSAIAEAVNDIGSGLQSAVLLSTQNERLKTDLITNVSHDIKTPLTSIINYVGLLKRENIDNPKVQNYIEILDTKSQRLKQLTEDLVEASRITSGNVELECTRLNFKELLNQISGEFVEKFQERDLELVMNVTKESTVIMADGRRLWRILENLYANVGKYAMERTRVYVDVGVKMGWVYCSVKNISQYALNIQASELTERFIRGDISRSTEGSGLGLSIARSLTELQGGSFDIYLDGDLFKVTVGFQILPDKAGITVITHGEKPSF